MREKIQTRNGRTETMKNGGKDGKERKMDGHRRKWTKRRVDGQQRDKLIMEDRGYKGRTVTIDNKRRKQGRIHGTRCT